MSAYSPEVYENRLRHAIAPADEKVDRLHIAVRESEIMQASDLLGQLSCELPK